MKTCSKSRACVDLWMPRCSCASQEAPSSHREEKHSQVVSKTAIFCNRPRCWAVYLCVTSESSRAGIARAVVYLSWSLENFCCRKTGGEPEECVNPTRRTRQSPSLQAPAPPHSRRCITWCRCCCRCLECALLPGSMRLPDPVTWRHSLLRLPVLCPYLSMLRQALQNGASGAPDAFAVAALDAFTDTARGVPSRQWNSI